MKAPILLDDLQTAAGREKPSKPQSSKEQGRRHSAESPSEVVIHPAVCQDPSNGELCILGMVPLRNLSKTFRMTPDTINPEHGTSEVNPNIISTTGLSPRRIKSGLGLRGYFAFVLGFEGHVGIFGISWFRCVFCLGFRVVLAFQG